LEKFVLKIKSIIICVILFGCALLLGCSDKQDDNSDNIVVSSEFQEVLDGLLGKRNLARTIKYQESLDELFDLGIYTFDPDDLLDCNKDDLISYYLRRQLPPKLVKRVKIKIDGMTGDEVFDYLLQVTEMTTEEINTAFKFGESYGHNDPAFTIGAMQDNIVTHLIWLASQRGSVDALNEIGAAQVYCYQGTEQDIESAINMLQKAADKGDRLALLTLGKIYYTGLGGFSDPELGKKLQDQAFEVVIDRLRLARQNVENEAPDTQDTK